MMMMICPASGEVSVRLSPCGWCWLVAGRRVVCWPREPAAPDAAGPAPPPAARELTLPQTDLAHKADLVELFYEDGAQVCSFRLDFFHPYPSSIYTIKR